jgi:ligand-binding SRPBCC domain-containing protein
MREGTTIDYRLRIHGIPIRWRSELTAWEPPRRFIDEQVRGPYKRWRHEHRLEPSDGGTRYIDDVRYELYGGPLAGLINRVMVQRDVRAIFAYRRDALERLLGSGGGAP